jgi:RNA polymerase sigma-70 factor (ECF subfamily)
LGESERVTAGADDLSDGAVVRAVLNGNEEAFAVLVRRYQDTLYRHAERMTGRPDEAIDIVQASFVRGFQSLEHCRDAERVGAWLFRINANLCKDYLKSRRRKDLRLADATPLPAERDDPEAAAERGELRDRIAGALERLSPDLREAFVLKHLEGLSYKEMSEVVEASVPALKMRVHRAREELQGLLEEYR